MKSAIVNVLGSIYNQNVTSDRIYIAIVFTSVNIYNLLIWKITCLYSPLIACFKHDQHRYN